MSVEAAHSEIRQPASRGLGAWLLESFIEERSRWILWLPVLMGTGVGVYFALTVEPPRWIGGVALVLAAAGLVLTWRSVSLLPAAIGIFAIALGFGAAEFQTWMAAAPVLEKRLGPVTIEGRLAEIDPLPGGRRVIIEPSFIQRLAADKMPARIRIRADKGSENLLPGERVKVRATLLPPPSPALPGAYDFQRRAYFERLGAVGYAVSPLERIPGGSAASWRSAVEALRTTMTDRIMTALPGSAGALASALITGQSNAIPQADAEAFRDAGLAHILSISGLHMSMIAGLAFFAFRAFLALIPPLALRYPIKKWAALATLLVIFGYMLLSGSTVASSRSFLMAGLVLVAVLVDRLSISARTIAFAAIVILLYDPVAAAGPSFQMSFGAVAALIAFYETFRNRFGAWHSRSGPMGRLGLYLFGICCTTMVSTVATMPFTIFHFNRFPLYSVAANLAAVPITGFWVMPWGLLGCFLMPFGLENLALKPMGWGLDATVAVAHLVASWPGSVLPVPTMPLWGLGLVSIGGIWLCIWMGRWRLLGLAPIAAGFLSILSITPPDVIISSESNLFAVRAADGNYLLSNNRRSQFAEDAWVRQAAAEAGPSWPAFGTSADGTLSCDAAGCLYRTKERIVAFIRDGTALEEDCRKASLVIAPIGVDRRCRRNAVVIDRFDTWRNGSYSIWLTPGEVKLVSVADWRGERPWSKRPQ